MSVARATLLAVVLLGVPLPAAAQQRVQVTATLPVQSPAGGGVRALGFGTITPVTGQAVVREVTAAIVPAGGGVQSGEFAFQVAGNRGVDFTLTLPTQLTDGSGHALPISFNDARYGAHCTQSASASCTPSSFNPAAGPFRACMQSLGNGSCHPTRVWPPGSTLRVFVGGAVSVVPTQPAGVYGGTIDMLIVQVY